MLRRAPVAVTLALFICAAALVFASRRAADAPATSDTAVIESYTRMATQGDLLVGAYSRFQWHHPGPLYFYLLAPFYAASGGKTTGLNAGATMVATASIALVAWVLVRRRNSLAVAMCAGMAIYAWRGAEALASPWNPHIPVLPLVALIVASAEVVAGTSLMLPIAALLASLVGQAHIALLPTALLLGGIAGGAAVARATAATDTSAARRSLAWTVVVLACVWSLPLYEQFTSRPRGNIAELWMFFTHQANSGQPLGVALSAWSDMFVGVLRPDFYVAHGWPFKESPVRWAEGLTLCSLGATAVIAVVDVRRGARFTAALGILTLMAAAMALWSVTRISEQIFDHDVYWIVGIGLLGLAVPVSRGLDYLGDRLPANRRLAQALTVLFLSTAGVAAGGEMRRAIRRSFDPPQEAKVAAALADDLAAFEDREQVVRPRIEIDQDSWGYVAGAILELQKRGRLVSVPEDWVVMFTPEFAPTDREEVTIMVAMPAEHERLTTKGARLISAHEPVFAHVISGR